MHKFIGHEDAVRCVLFSPCSKFVVSGSNDSNINIWEVNSGLLIKKLEGHKNNVTSVKISSDSQFLVSGSEDNSIIIWNIA